MNRAPVLVLAALMASAAPCFARQQDAPAVAYDPLRVDADAAVTKVKLAVHDESRHRDVPVLVYLPAAKQAAPVLLFSHGLGGSRKTSPFLGEHWARRGYVAVFLQHPGSDVDVWRGVPLRERMAKLRAAANGTELRARCLDVGVVLDELAKLAVADNGDLAGRLALEHVGMVGHSFGAVTTQAVGGQSVPLIGQTWLDPRIDAALPMSPSRPAGGDLRRAFAKVTIPWLCMTGTRDDSPIGDQQPEDRREVFANLPAGIDRYELVLDGATHGAFVGGEGLARLGARNPNHHRAILALSTAFWDAYLRGDEAARSWLLGGEARGVLEAEDVWQAVAAEPATAPADK